MKRSSTGRNARTGDIERQARCQPLLYNGSHVRTQKEQICRYVSSHGCTHGPRTDVQRDWLMEFVKLGYSIKGKENGKTIMRASIIYT